MPSRTKITPYIPNPRYSDAFNNYNRARWEAKNERLAAKQFTTLHYRVEQLQTQMQLVFARLSHISTAIPHIEEIKLHMSQLKKIAKHQK